LIVQQSSAFPRSVAKTEIVYAGFWRRALAYVIDATFLGGVAAALASSMNVLMPNDFQALANIVPVTAALWWAYFALLESSPAQGTIGKIALNLRVTDTHG